MSLTHTTLQSTWPCAVQIRHLLQGAHVQLDDLSAWASPTAASRPHKRDVEDALGTERNSDVLPREIFEFADSAIRPRQPSHSTHHHTSLSHLPSQQQRLTQDPRGAADNAGLVAQPMSVPISMPMQTPASYYPGYEWWPQSMMTMQQQYNVGDALRFYPSGSPSQQSQSQQGIIPDFGAQGAFTFDEGQLSESFTDGVGDVGNVAQGGRGNSGLLGSSQFHPGPGR